MNFRGVKNLLSVELKKECRVDSIALLVKAQTGVIPLASLRKFNLDCNQVAAFLARELLFLHTAAECANMNLLAALFYDLHTSLIETTISTEVLKSLEKSKPKQKKLHLQVFPEVNSSS
jgi:hypothetical protein